MKNKRKREARLKPSFRDDKRYLLIGKTSREKVNQAILEYIGILGYAKASPIFVKDDILAVNRKEIDKIKAALLLSGINVRRVSGTLRGLSGK